MRRKRVYRLRIGETTHKVRKRTTKRMNRRMRGKMAEKKIGLPAEAEIQTAIYSSRSEVEIPKTEIFLAHSKIRKSAVEAR